MMIKAEDVVQYIPTSSEEHLTIHLDVGSATELSAGEIGVVGGVDVVVTERLVHVLVDVQPVQEHRSILIRHQVSTEPIHRHLLCQFNTSTTTGCSKKKTRR